jgi:hypothetical protein
MPPSLCLHVVALHSEKQRQAMRAQREREKEEREKAKQAAAEEKERRRQEALAAKRWEGEAVSQDSIGFIGYKEGDTYSHPLHCTAAVCSKVVVDIDGRTGAQEVSRGYQRSAYHAYFFVQVKTSCLLSVLSR